MLVRETQTPAYWRGFAVDDRDLDYLDDLFLEDERPHTGDDLTLALMRKRCEDEESLIEKELARGILFQPKESYEVGQQVVFPVLGYALGPVVGLRPGYNPRYGDFEVIQVHFEGGEEPREFASKLDFFHKLNREEGEGSEADDLVSLTELYDRYGVDTQRILIEHLHHSEDFVSFGDEWFLKGLLTDIHEGLLNIVEAMLDVNGMPLPAQELIQELDLPAEISPSTQVFSLNYALTQDNRFDDVGSDDQILWFLRRLEPPEIAHLPLRLRYSPVLYDREGLGEELLRWEMEIDDEIAGLVTPGADEEISSATITLNYPHRRVGSIPLTSKIESLFPKGNVGRMMITLIDGRTGARMLGWVVRQHNYVYGLKEWYDKNDLPVGAYIELERTDDPMAIVVDYSRQRKKREWIRVATVVGGKLSFSMQMRSIGCKYDELMVLDEANQAEIDALWMRSEKEGKSISELMRDIFPELAKLNPQGTVHAKTLYSAINIERRCPPGPILAGLANMLSFMAVGDGYWVYDQEAL